MNTARNGFQTGGENVGKQKTRFWARGTPHVIPYGTPHVVRYKRG